MSRVLVRNVSHRRHPQSDRLGYMLKRAQHALRTNMDKKLEPTGLTTPQYNVLAAIEHEPGISSAELARGVFVTAQSMIGIILNLERIGMIRRNDDPSHGRIRRTELTKSGKATLAKAHKLLGGVEDWMTLGFRQEERKQLGDLLSRCIRNLDAGGK